MDREIYKKRCALRKNAPLAQFAQTIQAPLAAGRDAAPAFSTGSWSSECCTTLKAAAGGDGWRWLQLRSPNWKLEERTSAGRVQGMRGLSVLLGSPPKITHFTCKNDSAGTWWDWPSVLWLETARGSLGLCESMGCSANVVKLGRDPEWCRADAHASNVTRSSWRRACTENQTLWTTWPSINKDRPVC